MLVLDKDLPRLGLSGLSFKVRTIQFLYSLSLSSLRICTKNNYPKDPYL